MGKEEIARNKQFLLFPQCFLFNQKIVSPFVNIVDIISLFAAELEEPKIGISGKGLFYCQNIKNLDILGIVRCPKMYANFVEDEYMSVFAIALPYTNPFKWVISIFNPLPNNRFRDQSNLEAFADDILNVVQITICVTDCVENIMGKGENAGYQHFLLFPQCFQKPSFTLQGC